MKAQFDHFAEDYKALVDASIRISGEKLEYFADYKARYIAKRVPPDFCGKVLDFGCGTGTLSSFIKQYLPRSELHGYDVSSESIRRISPILSAYGYFTSDLSQLDKDYALVVLANVLHHVSPNQRGELIREVTSRLARSGKLIIFEHNPANPLVRGVVDRCPFDQDAILLRPKEAKHRMTEAKVRVAACDYIIFLPRVFSFLRPIEPRLSWLPLGAQYALVGEKDA